MLRFHKTSRIEADIIYNGKIVGLLFKPSKEGYSALLYYQRVDIPFKTKNNVKSYLNAIVQKIQSRDIKEAKSLRALKSRALKRRAEQFKILE